MAEEVRSNLAPLEVDRNMPSTRRASKPCQIVLSEMQRELPHILNSPLLEHQGIELHFVIMLAMVQAATVRSTIHA